VLVSQSLHVVFGAGQVGAGVARALARRGLRARVVRRSDAPVGDGVETVRADLLDPDAAVRAAEGAAVVYHCTNPGRYDAAVWEREVPRLGEGAIRAAVANGARLVVLDNLYAAGPVDGRRDERTPLAAEGRKGQVRAAWDARLRAAARDEGLRYVVGRAGDFFGVDAAEAVIGASALRGIAAGRPVLALASADAPHAFSWVPDVVEALVALGAAADDVEGAVFHLPVHEVPVRELVARYAAALGATPRVWVAPRWLVLALGAVVPLLRELRETLYQWDRPFLASDARFRARFPGLGATLDEAVRADVARLLLCPAHVAAVDAR
jgi:nucleoside-diphosphate-sugar epimerase